MKCCVRNVLSTGDAVSSRRRASISNKLRWLAVARAMALVAVFCFFIVPARADDKIRFIGKTKSGETILLSLDEIDAIGTITTKVYNPYEKREVLYSGVLLDKLVAHFGDPSVQRVEVSAIDNYRSVFDRKEWEAFRILFVTRTRGERFGLENKGPVRIVFIDFDPRSETHQVKLPKWMWMIEQVEFK